MRKCQEPSLHVLDCIASMRCRVNARGGITYLGAKALKMRTAFGSMGGVVKESMMTLEGSTMHGIAMKRKTIP